MSLLDLRVFSATLYPISSGLSKPVVLSNDYDCKNMSGFIVVPLKSNTLFWLASEDQYVSLQPGELLVIPGYHSGALFVETLRESIDQLILNRKSSIRDALTGKPITHRELGRENIAPRTAVGAVLIDVKLCEIIKGGFGLKLPDYYHMSVNSTGKSHIQNIGRLLLDYLDNQSVFQSEKVDRLTELLLIEVVESFFTKSDAAPSKLYRGFLDSRIRETIMAILQNPGHDWSVAELAEKAHMSRSLFAEKFKDALSETPLNFVRQCRIQHAKVLLVESSASLQKISADCGYSSLSAFVKSFLSVTGFTPGAWRKHKQSPELGKPDSGVPLNK